MPCRTSGTTGCQNEVRGCFLSIGNGWQNLVVPNVDDYVICHSAIQSGSGNAVTRSCSSIVGGLNNRVDSVHAGLMTGESNAININSDHSFIGGGRLNAINSPYAGVLSGESNVVNANSDHSAILSGRTNAISNSYAAVVGGRNNSIGDSYSTILNGNTNQIAAGGQCAVIGTGSNNYINAPYSTIHNGNTNIVNGIYSGVDNGRFNAVQVTGGYVTDFSYIHNGDQNLVAGRYNTVLNGHVNRVINGIALTAHSAILGGLNNTITWRCSTIAGGAFNTVDTFYSGIMQGRGNNIIGGANGGYSFMGGGRNNLIQPLAFPAVAANSVITGGSNNTVRSSCASVVGGRNNNLTGDFSAILGGSGNNDGGLNYVGIFGQNVNGVMANAFHVEELVAQNMPVGTLVGGIPTPPPNPVGSLWYYPDANGNNVVYII